ncbi:MAG: type II toxin-antitoxin system RelE/ParE family toxin [Deltaproteobacteria bacterium]|nr:type II toxin-antitoxin system RelE/ParE family toxin [Deltaproteobacteria bacterium]
MNKYQVVFSPAAQRDIEALDTADVLQVVRDVKSYLETSPLPFGKQRIKKMTGFKPPLYRLRSGDFRAYYRIAGDTVIILAVTDRKASEKVLRKIR